MHELTYEDLFEHHLRHNLDRLTNLAEHHGIAFGEAALLCLFTVADTIGEDVHKAARLQIENACQHAQGQKTPGVAG